MINFSCSLRFQSVIFFGFDVDFIVVITMSFYVSMPHFVHYRTTSGRVMTSYRFSTWQPRRHNTTFGFVFVDFTIFEMSKFVRKSNFVDITQSTAEICGLKKANVRHIRILPASSSTLSPSSAFQYASEYQILSKSDHPRLRYGVNDFQDGGRCGAILLPISDRVTSFSSEVQSLSANQNSIGIII